MSTAVIVGALWGDEGKGKIIDYLASKADVVVRGQGGNNAGHTVVVGDEKYALHLIPSGVLYPKTVNVIGDGVVLDPPGFLKEIEGLKARGVDVSNIYVSDRCHLVFSYHKVLDTLSEEAKGDAAIGTTKKGIGPTYMDKVERTGIRMIDFLSEEGEDLLRSQIRAKNEIITKIYQAPALNEEEIVAEYLGYREALFPFVTDTSLIVHEAVKAGKKVLLEGAQGSLLDIDYGTYPYVTSSHPIAGGFASGAGIGPNKIEEVLGVAKSYSTRVGFGPFVTELKDATGDEIREKGHEYGTTTGRPRRCGWFDAVAIKYTARINGMTSLAVTLLDVLSGFETVKICTGYSYKGALLETFPASLKVLDECTPVYEELPGWSEDISGVKDKNELPENAKKYLQRIESLIEVPVKFISVGPDRSQSIVEEDLF